MLAVSPSGRAAFVGVGKILSAHAVDPLVGSLGEPLAQFAVSGVRAPTGQRSRPSMAPAHSRIVT